MLSGGSFFSRLKNYRFLSYRESARPHVESALPSVESAPSCFESAAPRRKSTTQT